MPILCVIQICPRAYQWTETQLWRSGTCHHCTWWRW